MNQDDEDTRLRDQFAIAVMQAMVEKHTPFSTFIEKDDPDYHTTKEEYYRSP